MEAMVVKECDDEVFDRENAESEASAFKMLAGYVNAGNKVHSVSWKHEGVDGPMYVALVPRRPVEGVTVTVVPFGDDCKTCGWPEGMHSRAMQEEGAVYLGWVSQTWARGMARRLGVPLEVQ